MTDLITTALVRLDADLGSRQERRHPGAGPRRRRRRALRRPRPARRGRDRPRGDGGDRTAGRHRHPPLPHHRGRGPDPGLRPALAEGRVRRQGRSGRPRLPDRRSGRRRRHPPPAAHQARPRAGQAGLHRQPARAALRPGGRRARARRRRRRARHRRRSPGRAAPARPASRVARRGHRLPDRHRAHLHGGRGARGGGGQGRRTDRRRDAGLGRLQAPGAAPPSRLPSAVIFAVDVGVRDRGRFAGKPVVSSGVKRPIDDGDAMIAEALRYADDPNAPRVEGALTAGEGNGGGGAGESWGGRTRRVLMTGVSYMIPFVAAGGLLIALGFLFGGYEIGQQRVRRDRRRTTRCSTCPTPRPSDSTTCSSAPVLRLRVLGLPRCALLHHRQDGVRALRPGAGRLHRLRDRRPARHRARLHHGRARHQPFQRRRHRPAPHFRRPGSSAPSSAACSPAWSPTGSRAGGCRRGRAA